MVNETTDFKELFMIKSILGRKTNFDDPESVIKACIRVAYRDMLTAGKYYLYKKDASDTEKKKKKDGICEGFLSELKNHGYEFSLELIKNTSKLIGDNNEIGNVADNKYATTFGLAQKLVNMTFKYLLVCSDYTNISINCRCHCPLDSIILEKIGKKDYKWSKLSQKEYEELQETIKAKLSELKLNGELDGMGNLAFDFINW